MRGILLHTFYSAKRDKLVLGLLFAMVIGSFIAAFLGSTSLVENDQMRVIYSATICRYIIMIGMMVFISFHMKKLFENKEMDVMLSRIPSRSSIVIAFVTSFALVAFVVVGFAAAITMLVYLKNFVNILYWGVTVALESLIVVSFTTFFCIVMRSPSLALLMTFATYMIGRIIGNFIAYIDISSANTSLLSISEVTLKTLSIVMPRLDLFGKTDIIIHSNYDLKGFLVILAQSLVYSMFLTLLGIFDMRRKEF